MNRLSKEQSPYLRQHGENPVDWYPWCDEAIERAKEEGKPILLSIGYSACHWCHVMERESFENEEIAKLMNDKFINIKVDREERPDLDEVYMNAVQMMTGSGGWPLTAFLTPELVPFYGGTYFPPEDRQGMPGFKKVLLAVAVNYVKNRDAVNDICKNVMSELDKITAPSKSEDVISEKILNDYCEYLKSSFDGFQGGFGSAPKFPRYHELLFLLKMYEKTNENGVLQMVLFTLKKMAEGGIRDHIGGGFHRYSVDAQWFAPHFEKMLYDNALLAPLYFRAYQISEDPSFLKTGEEILKFVKSEMMSREGIFYSSLDADSEGEEGKYYTWEKNEIEKLLEKDDSDNFCKIFGVEDHGNFETGRNIIFLKDDIKNLSKKTGMSEKSLEEKLIRWKQVLYRERTKRIRPSTDDKCVTAWNGLMISAFAEVFLISGEEEYVEIALRAGEFFCSQFREEGKLFRFYREGKGFQDAFLVDYGAVTEAFIYLYKTTLDLEWIRAALELKEKTLSLFGDSRNGGFFNSVENPDLLVRSKSSFDNPIPSGNSIMFKCLIELWHITENEDDIKKAEMLLKSFSGSLQQMFHGYPAFLNGIFDYFCRQDEVVVAVREKEKYRKIVKKIYSFTGLTRFLWGVIDDGNSAKEEMYPLLKGKRCPDKRDFALYYCKNRSCLEPVYSVSELEAQK